MADDEDVVVKDGIYAGMLRKEFKGTPSKVKSKAENSFANQKGTLIPANLFGGVQDFLRDSGIVVGSDTDFQFGGQPEEVDADENALLAKLRRQGTIKSGSTVQHTERPGIFVVLRTNVDTTKNGTPRHLVVNKLTGEKFRASVKKLTMD